MVRRTSPSLDDDEVDRRVQPLLQEFGDGIKDRDSFDYAFLRFLDQVEYESGNQKVFADKVWERVRKRKGLEDQKLFTKAGGKNLKKDRQIAAKTVVTTPAEYIRRGARRVDLAGYDTVGIDRKGRIVKARRVQIIIRGKRYIRYRDQKGRFTKR